MAPAGARFTRAGLLGLSPDHPLLLLRGRLRAPRQYRERWDGHLCAQSLRRSQLPRAQPGLSRLVEAVRAPRELLSLDGAAHPPAQRVPAVRDSPHAHPKRPHRLFWLRTLGNHAAGRRYDRLVRDVRSGSPDSDLPRNPRPSRAARRCGRGATGAHRVHLVPAAARGHDVFRYRPWRGRGVPCRPLSPPALRVGPPAPAWRLSPAAPRDPRRLPDAPPDRRAPRRLSDRGCPAAAGDPERSLGDARDLRALGGVRGGWHDARVVLSGGVPLAGFAGWPSAAFVVWYGIPALAGRLESRRQPCRWRRSVAFYFLDRRRCRSS